MRLHCPALRYSRARYYVQVKQHCRLSTKGSDNVDAPQPSTRTQHATKTIKDEYAVIKEKYATPKHPIVLAHGLLGFDELRLLGPWLPGIRYWRGIKEALEANGTRVITAAVGPTDSIEERAAALADCIARQTAPGEAVNIVAHSMGGLDARYMISRLLLPRPHHKQQQQQQKQQQQQQQQQSSLSSSTTKTTKTTTTTTTTTKTTSFEVKSLTTIASPHRGSAFADFVLDRVIGPRRLPAVYRAMRALGIPTGAWTQLTRGYMRDEFNPSTPDVAGVKYYSYGANFSSSSSPPTFWSAFWYSERVVRRLEGGSNDGLVSVESSKWGEYRGTIEDVSHLDLINWTNRLKWILWELAGRKRNFNAVALYLGIADMLAKEGL